MTPEQLDRAEAHWVARFDAAVDQVISIMAERLIEAGNDPQKVAAHLARERTKQANHINNYRRSIRPLILRASLGLLTREEMEEKTPWLSHSTTR